MTDDQRPTDRVTDGPLMELHDQLVDAIVRQNTTVSPILTPRRRPRAHLGRQLLVAAAAVVVMVGTALFITTNDDRSNVAADVDVQRTADGIVVSIESSVTVAEIDRALTAAGVDVDVLPMRTGPSRVDHFVSISADSGRLVGGDGTTTNKAILEKGDHVALYLGVPADGQPYDATTNAWSHGEALAGSNLEGKQLSEIQGEIDRRAAASGARIEYHRQSDMGVVAPEPGDVLIDASGVSADTVFVIVDR